MLYVPMAVDEPTVMVILEVPDPVMDLGFNVMVTPAGWPVADKEIPDEKPFVTVLEIVDVAVPPGVTETMVGAAVRPKLGVLMVLSSALMRALPFGLPQPVAKS